MSPFGTEKRGNKWVVVNKDTGSVKGTHDSKADAKAQLTALRIHVHDSGTKPDKKSNGG